MICTVIAELGWVGAKISVILSCTVTFLRQYRLHKRLPGKLKLKLVISKYINKYP